MVLRKVVHRPQTYWGGAAAHPPRVLTALLPLWPACNEGHIARRPERPGVYPGISRTRATAHSTTAVGASTTHSAKATRFSPYARR